MRRKRLTDSISVEELQQMYDAGMSQREIAEAVGCSQHTISNYLRGHCNRGRGGRVASRIDKHDFAVEPKREEMQAIAEKNAANACLVVASKQVVLEGMVGSYHVFGKDETIVIEIGKDMTEVKFDALPGLIEELKAIARNIDSVKAGCEAW